MNDILGRYILDGHKAVPEPDLLKWGQWLETANRHVGQDEIGTARVSTVFLGLDHSFGDGPPLLFETMVFGGKMDGETWRYETWEQAAAGHKAVIDQVRAAEVSDD